MRKTLFEKNIEKIEHILITYKKAYSLKELNALLGRLKSDNLVAKDMKTKEFFEKLQNRLNLKTYSVTSEKINKDRYSLRVLNEFSIVSTFEKDMFFPASTSLNIQGLSNFRNDFIFYAKELTKKSYSPDKLTQENIDKAFEKPYRTTNFIAKYKKSNLVYLTPKYTDLYEIIDFGEYKISSVNRSFVEMLINVQYFKSFDKVIECFKPIKDKLDLHKVYQVLERFELIYPYHQLVGFALENIGFKKDELKKFKDKVSEFNFYTEKNKLVYAYNRYWKIYYQK